MKKETKSTSKSNLKTGSVSPELETISIMENNSSIHQRSKAIDITTLPGVGAATAEKLESSGFRDLMV